MNQNPLPWNKARKNIESSAKIEEPNHTLIRYASLVPEGKVLDLGIGSGRDGLFFARMGFEVEGVDISESAIRHVIKRSQKANLEVQAHVADVRELDIPQGEYSLIIAAWVFPFLRKNETEKLIVKIKNGLKKDGLVYCGVFSLDDSLYKDRREHLEMCEENTFYLEKRNIYFHYFTKEELLSLFDGLNTIYYAEGIFFDISHGEPHYHDGFIEYVGQKCQ